MRIGIMSQLDLVTLENHSNILTNEGHSHSTVTNSTPSLRDNVIASLDNYMKNRVSPDPVGLYDLVLQTVEEPLLQRVMLLTHNNQTVAAKMLGLNRGTLRKKLKRYDLL